MVNQNFDNVIQSDIFIQQGTTGDWKKNVHARDRRK